MIEGRETSGEEKNISPPQSTWKIFLLGAFALLLCGLLLLWYASRSPSTVTKDIFIDIPRGSTVGEISQHLYAKGVIRSADLFYLAVRLAGLDTTLPSGTFLFHTPLDLFGVVAQLGARDHGITRVKITIPEGFTVAQIGKSLSTSLPDFDTAQFTALAKDKEGYLFPDTYFFFITATSGEVIESLEANFQLKTALLYADAKQAAKPWSDIVVMASLIEEEAVIDVDRKIISGILWNRIGRGMRLQVDAPFVYIMNKASSELTLDDLNHDSPYNTYRYAGLPPKPISNPGLAALSAALYPTQTEFLFYLSDKNGAMHYAKTFAEHKLNKARYLR